MCIKNQKKNKQTLYSFFFENLDGVFFFCQGHEGLAHNGRKGVYSDNITIVPFFKWNFRLVGGKRLFFPHHNFRALNQQRSDQIPQEKSQVAPTYKIHIEKKSK